ncbi:TOBE domain-containing protein [Candidatus Marinarcus aquaticus]|uniref:Transporter n=1 Tax=Candidatus Marinarcus aquaticus TaxID=2044504 RepID=A0A4Q0XR95_9BACT|nr:TOBE domain-containing protein [Candidatus Marinarcus aquaticus]RXJ58094.1 transporter [Candidatus Marinarcus aquaticus]
MNQIVANVTRIDTIDNLNIVEFEFQTTKLKMMSLDLSNITVGQKVVLSVKPTHIAVAKELSGMLSYSNQLITTISKIEMGELLCTISTEIFSIPLQSIITADSAKRMNLQLNDEITLLIKASDLSILDVYHD